MGVKTSWLSVKYRVAVIGAGMAGRAHAAGYRNLHSLYGDGVPQ